MKKTVAALCGAFWLTAAGAQMPETQPERIVTPMKTRVSFTMDKAALKELPSIKNTTQAFQDAWNARDVKAVISHYAPSASVMDHEGNQAMGTEQVQSWLQQSFAGLYKNANSEFEVSNVRMLGPNLALVDLHLTSQNMSGKEGQALSPQEFHITVVGQKKANKWLIHDMRSYQFTRPEQLGIGGAGIEPYELPKQELPQP